MLYLAFNLGAEHYALAARLLVEVVPRVPLRCLPGTPDYVAGLLEYRGRIVPVIDLWHLTLGVPAPARLSTRILLARYSAAQLEDQILGLVVGQVTDTVFLAPETMQSPGLRPSEAPFLGPLGSDGGSRLQVIELERILPPALRAALFTDALGSPAP